MAHRVCFAIMLAACGGGGSGGAIDAADNDASDAIAEIDLTGMYRVDSAVGSSPCGADAPVAFAAFLRFERMMISGQSFFTFEGCADAAGTDCEELGGLFAGLFTPVPDGWTGVTSISSGGGSDDCNLAFTTQAATVDALALELELFSHAEAVPGLTTEQCTPDEAGRRGTTMPCASHTLVDATKL